jgi:hypothetical protein
VEGAHNQEEAMKTLFLLLVIIATNAQAESRYLDLLESYEKEALYLKRKKIINDNYECKQYFQNESIKTFSNILRMRRYGSENVHVTFKNTPWNNTILKRFDSYTYGAQSFELRRVGFGHLLIKVTDSILECKFPPSDDDFWDF